MKKKKIGMHTKVQLYQKIGMHTKVQLYQRNLDTEKVKVFLIMHSAETNNLSVKQF